jgi:hypothetical protein
MTPFTEKLRESEPGERGHGRRWQVFTRPALAVARPGLDQRDRVTPAGQANRGGSPRGSRTDDERVSGHDS